MLVDRGADIEAKTKVGLTAFVLDMGFIVILF